MWIGGRRRGIIISESTAEFDRAVDPVACFTIRELEIIGFKSFAEKATFTFSSGINCITGRNGSGLSNLFDAVDWVLGKELQNAIFAGSVLHPPADFAEVTATFDNRSRRLNVDCDDVTIRRAMNRQAEDYFLLNGRRLTASEVGSLFGENDRGIAAYARFGQDRLYQVLGGSRQRREFFDEALGLSIFRRQLLEASRHLKEAQANLKRVQDIQSHIRRELMIKAADLERSRTGREDSSLIEVNSAEYKHLKEMFDHQEKQLDDLGSSSSKAKDILTERRSEASRFLAHAISEASNKFSALLSLIWQDSSASIYLTDQTRPLASDIEIQLKLSGRPGTALKLLYGGGDKANAVIMLMFAAYATNPPHFCVLDDTDAALDDENIEPFILLLREFAPSTQIILATHKKKVTELAQTMYQIATDERP